MTIEEKLKSIIIEKHGSVLQFTKSIGMANSTFATIMKKGVHNASVTNIIKICEALGISADELAQDRIVFTEHENHKCHNTDIEKIVYRWRMQINDISELTIDGIPLTENEFAMLLDGFELTVGLIKRNRERNGK